MAAYQWSNVLRLLDSTYALGRPIRPPIFEAALAMIVLSICAGAQAPQGGACGASVSDSDRSGGEQWSFGAWLAAGTHEPIKTREGHMEDRALYITGITASRPINRWRFGDLRFTPTLVPGILATANREYRSVQYPGGGVGLLPYKKSAFGVGLIPVAFEATALASPRAGIVLGGGGGAAYFDRRIPDPEETRFNFLADGHAGVYLRSTAGVTTFGFRLQHISNGNTGRVNPGLDSRMLYIAFRR